MNINHIYISDKSNFKKLIPLLMKIVIIIFNIIINIIVIENSNEKEFFYSLYLGGLINQIEPGSI